MNAKMMRAIRVFTRTVELGRMGAAAEDLHMTTSAVSQQLQKLESDLGLSLFNRNTRNLVLTEAGKIQYQCCRTMLEVAEKAREDIEQLQGTPCGTLKVIA
ncbi:LysR family transcriptional regulator, partial [Marinimicrobium sp. UBA4509]